MRHIGRLGLYAFFLALLFGFAGCKAREDSAKPSVPAVDFTLANLSGQSVTLGDYRGEANVLIHFGTTWCPPCIEEVPVLNKLHSKYSQSELVILYVDSREPGELVRKFVDDHEIKYETLLDLDGAVAAAYGVEFIPLNVLVDSSGMVAATASRAPIAEIEKLVGR